MTRTTPVVLGLAVVLATSAYPASNRHLEKARHLAEDVRYPEAAKELESAWATPGNDRADTLEILRLQGIVNATMGQTDRARAAFRMLFYLDPTVTLPADELGPKVMTPADQVRSQLPSTPLSAAMSAPRIEGDRVRALSVSTQDPLKVLKGAVFHLREDGGEWETVDAALVDGRATLPVNGKSVVFWVSFFGDKRHVFIELGSADHPLEAHGQAPAKLAQQLPSSSPAPPPPPPSDELSAEPSHGQVRWAPYALWGGAAASLVAGLALGAASASTNAAITNASRDDSGRVTSITRAEALTMADRARTQATLANVLFGASAAMAAAGVAVFALTPDTQVAVTPAGAAVGGRF